MRDHGTGPTSLVEMLTLARGVYRFSVDADSARATPRSPAEGLFPALQVIAAPGQAGDVLERIAPSATDSIWLCDSNDSIVLRVKQDGTQVVVLLLTQPGLAPLRIDLRKLDEAQPTIAPRLAQPGHPPVAPADAMLLRSQVVVHAEYVGDVIGMDQGWTGAIDESRAIECLTITPIADIAPVTLEYRALSAAGLETGWVEQGQPCGTRGMALPLLGFALRQRPGRSARLVCEYAGRFASGRVVGPLRNGEICRSPDANDRLIGIWFHLIDTDAQPATPRAAPPGPAPLSGLAAVGPRFSVLEDVTA